MNVKKLFIFFIILLISISVVSASDSNDTDISDTAKMMDDNQVNYDNVNIDKNTVNNNIKKDSKTIVLNSTSFDNYVTNGTFNNNVTDGDTVDIQGLLDNTRFGLTVNKPVNIISSTNDAYIGADSPMGFTINNGGSGTNLTGVHFNNVHFVIQNAHDIHINNITVETANMLVGSGRGVTSIREDSCNITVNNSYFKSDNNIGVSTLVCAVAQDVLIENCTVEGIGFVGNLVYFTTYNVGYDTSRGYGNRNITFRNNHIIGLEAIQQSICYGLTMEGIGHTIENNIIEYGYYCIQQQANVEENDEVSRIIIRNNTIPYGTNNIAYATIENNTFNEIERLKECNFTNNIANTVNITGTSILSNNTINTLYVVSDNNTVKDSTITGIVEITGNNNLFENTSMNFVINQGENNTLNNNDSQTVTDKIVINNNNCRDYGGRSGEVLTISNNIPDNSYVYVDGASFYTYINRIVITTSAINTTFKIDSSKVYNITVNSTNLTIKDTSMPYTSIYVNDSVKLVNSIFLSTDTPDNFVLNNSTIYSMNNYIVYDDDTYTQIFDQQTGVLLDNITDNSTIIIRNKNSNGVNNTYNNSITINKKVNILSLDKSEYNANINLISGSQNLLITNMTVNADINIKTDNITVKNIKTNSIILNNSNNVLIKNNTFNSNTTAITLISSQNNNIISNTINTDSQYTIEIDQQSTDNCITENYLKSATDYNYYSVNADFTQNNITENKPSPFSTNINMELPSKIVLNTPVELNINVTYYKDLVDEGYIVILVNGRQMDNITLTNGTASVNITFTDDGTNTIKIWYFGTDSYATSTLSKNITAKKISTKLNITELTSVKVGENLTVTVKVTDEDDENVNEGNVTFTIKDEEYTCDVTDGIATLNITTKDTFMGSQITIYYSGTLTRYNNTITSTLSIQKGELILKITKSEVTDNNITITVYATDINDNPLTTTGRIKITGTDITASTYLTLNNSIVTYTITPKPSQDFNINVSSRNFNAFENKVQEFTIPVAGPKNATITLTAENTKIGENLILTAQAKDQDNNPIDNQTIIFNIGENKYTTILANGTATYTIQTTSDDYNKTINAILESSAYYNQATSNNITLEKADTILTITQQENKLTVTLTITVTDTNNNTITPANITITDEDETFTYNFNQTLTYTTNKTNEDKTIIVTFNSPAYNQNTTQITIAKLEIYTIKVDTTNFTIGQNSQIKASIYLNDEISQVNKGKVVFKINGKTLKDSNAKIIYAKVVNGTAVIDNYTIPSSWYKQNITIEAVYSGSSQCESLRSQKEQLTINKAQPTITTESINTTIASTITLKATITDSDKIINSGKVVFKINGKTVKDENGKVIYLQVTNNTATLEYTLPTNLKAKTYDLTATFILTGYERLQDTKTLTINQ